MNRLTLFVRIVIEKEDRFEMGPRVFLYLAQYHLPGVPRPDDQHPLRGGVGMVTERPQERETIGESKAYGDTHPPDQEKGEDPVDDVYGPGKPLEAVEIEDRHDDDGG